MDALAPKVAARYAAMHEALPFQWKGDIALFNVEGTAFEFAFKNRHITHPTYGPIQGFQAEFYKTNDKGMPWMYKPTGDGNAFVIFATVGAILREFLAKRKPLYVWFTADEPSRVRLYDALIRRMNVSGYVGEATATGKYTLRRTV